MLWGQRAQASRHRDWTLILINFIVFIVIQQLSYVLFSGKNWLVTEAVHQIAHGFSIVWNVSRSSQCAFGGMQSRYLQVRCSSVHLLEHDLTSLLHRMSVSTIKVRDSLPPAFL